MKWLKSILAFIVCLVGAYVAALLMASFIMWDNLFVLAFEEMPGLGRFLLLVFCMSVAFRIVIGFFPPFTRDRG